MIGWATYCDEHKVTQLSLHEAIDTTNTLDKLAFRLLRALAVFEHNLVGERA